MLTLCVCRVPNIFLGPWEVVGGFVGTQGVWYPPKKQYVQDLTVWTAVTSVYGCFDSARIFDHDAQKPSYFKKISRALEMLILHTNCFLRAWKVGVTMLHIPEFHVRVGIGPYAKI